MFDHSSPFPTDLFEGGLFSSWADMIDIFRVIILQQFTFYFILDLL